MPIDAFHFEGRIFAACETGYISQDEAKVWAEQLKQHADASAEPIVALVDALKVTFVSPAASLVFSKASHHANLLAVVVATSARISGIADAIGRIGVQGKTHIS